MIDESCASGIPAEVRVNREVIDAYSGGEQQRFAKREQAFGKAGLAWILEAGPQGSMRFAGGL
jgi:hypothetical protein